jgi:hypothetical protein
MMIKSKMARHLLLLALIFVAASTCLAEDASPIITHKVFFDIEIGGEKAGRGLPASSLEPAPSLTPLFFLSLSVFCSLPRST